MNASAQKKARQAELEDYLLEKFYKCDHGQLGDFTDWLEHQAIKEYWGWNAEAKELIALYEEGTL